jgi:hypothetical protein
MEKFYDIIIYIPFVFLIIAILCTIVAAVFVAKHMPYRKLMIIACIGYAIPILYILILWLSLSLA